MEILLNLKQIKFKGLLETPFITHIVQGPQLVTATNISLPSGLNLINPNQYIAAISEQTNFEIELKIESGTGYNFTDEGSRITLKIF